MTKRYIITVIETGQEELIIGKTWELGAGETEKDFGYTPETVATRDYEREVFRQTVDKLDLDSVVLVVNGLGKPAGSS